MFGLAAAAQYAGWWNGGVRAATSVNITTTQTNPFVVRPRYYADMTGITNASGQCGIGPVSNTQQFDQTGMGTNEKKAVQSITFRMGSDYMVSAPSNTYTPGVTSYNIFETPSTGSSISRSLSIATRPGQNTFQFGASNTGVNITLTPAQTDLLRNRWITLIASYSDTSSSFSNWTGGSDGPGLSWAVRTLIVDVETQTILHLLDGWVSNSALLGIDLTQQWTVGYGGSDHFINTFQYAENDWLTYDRKDIQVGSTWFAIGDQFDPSDVANYSQLATNAVNPVINAQTALIYSIIPGPGVVNNGLKNQDIPLGSRAGAIYFSVTTPATFNNFN